MIVPLLILFVLFLVFGGIGAFTNNPFSDYAINISVELLGALITVLCIDIYLRNNENRLAKKRADIAWTLLKPTVRSNFHLLFLIYKASATQKGVNLVTSQLSNFFNIDFLDNYSRFNIFAEAPVVPSRTWMQYLKYEFEKINKDYDSILDKYAIHLDPDMVKVIEDIKTSTFHRHITESLSLIEATRLPGHQLASDFFGQLMDKEYVLEPYIKSLKQLLRETSKSEIMANFFSIDDGSWRNDISPKIGSSRL